MIPNLLFVIGFFPSLYAIVVNTLYANYYHAASALLLYFAWLVANSLQGKLNISTITGRKQRVVAIGMALCLIAGSGMLILFEMNNPKYLVPSTTKTLYKVPPMLSKTQLRKLGAECNTYGNTLCSHDVFKKIVQLNPNDFNSLANLAMAQSHLGFHKYAIANFKKSIDNGGIETFDVYKFYGHSLYALKQYKKAQKYYQASLLLNDNQELVKSRLRKLAHFR